MERIVSLVPSLTELVAWLGAGDQLVGRTRFCTHPEDLVATVPAIGGTKDPDVAAIIALQSTLVVANNEENRREDVEALEAAGLRVIATDPNTVAEAAAMVGMLGAILERMGPADELASAIEAELSSDPPVVRVFVATWWRPLMAMAGNTFGDDLLRCAGGLNVFGHLSRYPEVSLEAVAAQRPDHILLPDEPFHFQERHIPAFSAIAPTQIIDGKIIWWYGPRLPKSIRTLRSLLHGQAEWRRSSPGRR